MHRLCRCGDHVLLSGGPLVARTGLCSQYEVTAVHSLGEGSWGLHRRAQGLSLPLQLQAHHTVWRKLRQRAEKLVRTHVYLLLSSSSERVAAVRSGLHPCCNSWLFYVQPVVLGCSHHFIFHQAARGEDLTLLFLLLWQTQSCNLQEKKKSSSHPPHEGQTAVF